ncbi:MAG: tyrosine-type recombinase/integrase [Actinomycetota bacterium]
MPGRDTKTRFQGVYARHQERCATTASGSPKACNCSPSYYASVWDRTAGKYRKTKRFPRVVEARNARADLIDALRQGKIVDGAGLRLGDACQRFVDAAREGVALNKWGRRYRRRAVEDLESALRQIPSFLARRKLVDVRRGEIQRLIDQMTAADLSGSRVRSVVNAIRSLYRWAQDRELADHDPAANVRLPVMGAKPRDRVATPREFARLLDAIRTPEEADTLPWGLAGYATARHQEIRTLDWAHVDLELGAIELAADEEGRKPGGSWRVVPLVSPLRSMLRRAWIAQSRPSKGKVCPARRQGSRSGLLALGHLQEHVHERWRQLGMEPIGLHEARHTAATWLDHAGVTPKVASQLMGHRTPEYQPGAAPITLRRYTHTLPGELERARDLLGVFLTERAREEGAAAG